MILLDAYVYGCDCISSSVVYGFIGCFFCMYNGVIIVCHVDLSLNCKFNFFFDKKMYCRDGSIVNCPYKSIL